MGKGLPAALLMATVRASMRALCRDTEPVVNIRYAAKALEPDLMRSESFVTLFHAQLDIRQSILRYVDAGHGHTLMVRCNGSVQELGPRGVPLGAFPDETYCQGEIRFDAGDTLLVYSDGLIDAQPQFARHRMGLVQHLQGAGSAAEILERVIAIAQAGFVGPQTDDLTVLVLQRTPEL
jgi:serine phosphatase RsbU (regulator of sigma subunit)